jgi:hypothetical protein
MQLRRTLMTCLLFEDTFYENGKSMATRIEELVKLCTFEELHQLVLDSREKMKLRHAPLLVLRAMLPLHKGRPMGDLIFRTVQRPDELGELLALYWAKQPKAPLANQLKIGLARALKKFSEFELAKWNRDAAVRLRDVLFLTHARPRHIPDHGGAVKQPAINRPGYQRGKVLRHPGTTLDLLAKDALPVPETWEVALSSGADKRAVFTTLLLEQKLGALALLRNLRNMIEAGVDEDLIRTGLESMNTERVLPFRFITAAKYVPRLEDALEQAMFRCLDGAPHFAGNTALLVDHSGSMDAKVSGKSALNRLDAACAVAMLLREVCARGRVFAFSTHTVEVPPRRGFALAQAVRGCMPNGGTALRQAVDFVYHQYPECDRLIVITDEQSQDHPAQPQGRGYICNVAGYKNGIGYGKWVTISGWSEALVDFIRMYEENDQE